MASSFLGSSYIYDCPTMASTDDSVMLAAPGGYRSFIEPVPLFRDPRDRTRRVTHGSPMAGPGNCPSFPWLALMRVRFGLYIHIDAPQSCDRRRWQCPAHWKALPVAIPLWWRPGFKKKRRKNMATAYSQPLITQSDCAWYPATLATPILYS